MDFIRRAFPEDATDAMKLYSSVSINMNNEIAFSCWLRSIIKIFTNWFPGGLTIAIRIDHIDRIEEDENDNHFHEFGEIIHGNGHLLLNDIDDATDNESESGSSSIEEFEVESDSEDEHGEADEAPEDQVRRLRQVIQRETKVEILCNIGRNHDI